ncbi:MAG TPA: DEAD/DEAH box helicase [Flavobacteriales bacterium]|nr:DEAD/DEAH box helicase [Flavobacteriales bacterium]
MKFSELNLITPILSALERKGYQEPTPIQQKSIPHVLAGRDVFGCAQTGTGKTAAFAIPLLQLIAGKKNTSEKKLKTLILAPTRELAMQISENIETYSANLDIRHATVFGGISQVSQVNALKRGVDVLIATPGRMLDLMQQGYINLHHIEYFVLDEADKMLDMGFINDIRKILAKMPLRRQTLFFSATASKEIMSLAGTLLNNPVHVSVTPVSSTTALVKQHLYFVKKENKRLLLKHVLTNKDMEHVLVFTRTKRGADKVAKELNKHGIKAEAIHGNKSQNARTRTLAGFKNKSIRVLVATDIASRGIDIDKLSHVINYELPEQCETYVHRIGRTGRAGNPGTAISFCSHDEKAFLNDISKLIKKDLEVIKSHPFTEN